MVGKLDEGDIIQAEFKIVCDTYQEITAKEWNKGLDSYLKEFPTKTAGELTTAEIVNWIFIDKHPQIITEEGSDIVAVYTH